MFFIIRTYKACAIKIILKTISRSTLDAISERWLRFMPMQPYWFGRIFLDCGLPFDKWPSG